MHVLNLQRKKKWLSFVPVLLLLCRLFQGPLLSVGFFPLLNALGFNTCEGLTQATPALRRNPVSLRLRITKQDNHSIHLFIGYCSATLPSEKGPFQWGTFFFLLLDLSSPFDGFSWKWVGRILRVQKNPPILCLLWFFFSTYQRYEEESILQSWRWT